MRPATINGKPVGQQPVRQVVSRSAILILSGVLLGTTLGQGELGHLSINRSAAGTIGLISFLALDLVAQRRQKAAVRKSVLESTDSTLVRRLRRHIAATAGHLPRRPRLDSSYLTVTRRWK